LTLTRTHAALLLAALASAAAMLPINARIRAQTQPQAPASAAASAQQIPQPPARPQPPPQPARALVLLDPAHGGPDSGATLGNNVVEKDVTLAFAARLRAALTSAGFAVIATRDADTPGLLTPDQRAETANRTHATACLVLHATAVGSGVHLYISTLPPAPDTPDADADFDSFVPVPWESAQAGFVDQSRHLADDLRTALAKASVPTLGGQAPLRPLDNLMCPAVAIEIAPSAAADGSSTPASDADYQLRVAAALSTALQAWRAQAAAAATAAAQAAAQTGAPQ
jgi:N-acetylmuramoyl-L-alanine amidase